eukprot:5608391-Prymnesium_polylepis.1
MVPLPLLCVHGRMLSAFRFVRRDPGVARQFAHKIRSSHDDRDPDGDAARPKDGQEEVQLAVMIGGVAVGKVLVEQQRDRGDVAEKVGEEDQEGARALGARRGE